MSLQSAATAKTASDVSRLTPDTANQTIVEIDALITLAKSNGLYRINIDRVGRIENKVTDIKQTDATFIDINTIIYALEENNYRVSCNKKNISTGFKINITVAWS